MDSFPRMRCCCWLWLAQPSSIIALSSLIPANTPRFCQHSPSHHLWDRNDGVTLFPEPPKTPQTRRWTCSRIQSGIPSDGYTYTNTQHLLLLAHRKRILGRGQGDLTERHLL
uniref:Putative secreted peptide n=1 Tax=Anopheles braziliensis TaxID=58242 RepID=A0A2M3ZSY7_9DIPT